MISSKPLVAILGRPNVGKSTLFNRLVGKRLAIVHDEPGVTRDRHYADASALGRAYTLIDTGGFDPASEDSMQWGIQRQIDLALGEADLVLCVLDGSAPVAGIDAPAVALLRRSPKPVLYVANKCDSDKQDVEAADLYGLGMDELHFVSALHGRGMVELDGAIARALAALPGASEDVTTEAPVYGTDEPAGGVVNSAEELVDDDAPEAPRRPPVVLDPLRVAIVGRPNSGKSSLVNRLLGEDRQLVHDAPGTTRDAIDAHVEIRGKRWVLVDTAGLRRKGSVAKARDVVEARSVLQGIRAMERALLVVLLCDAERGVDEQDAKILGLAVDRHRGIVIGLNKADRLDARELRQAEERARDKLAFAPWAPIVPLSALKGTGTAKLLRTLQHVGTSYAQRVPTGELNRFFEQVLATHPPPTHGGRAPRFYYVTQPQIAPPLFVIQASHPDCVHFSYQRYVVNAIRKRFGFEGVPVRVEYRRPGRRPARR